MALGIKVVGQDYNKIKLQDLNKSDVAAIVAQNQDFLGNPYISKIGNDIASNDVKNNAPVDTAAIIAENKKKQKQQEAGSDVSAVLAMSSQPPISNPAVGNNFDSAKWLS